MSPLPSQAIHDLENNAVVETEELCLIIGDLKKKFDADIFFNIYTQEYDITVKCFSIAYNIHKTPSVAPYINNYILAVTHQKNK